MSTGALERIVHRARDRRAQAREHCDLCNEPLTSWHRHVLDTDGGQMLCTCQACSLLFNRDVASNGHYRLVPDRRIRVPAASTKQLGVPVGLAYFVRGDDDVVVAHYPSPLGSTEWEIERQAWRQLITDCPPAADLATQTEALLVNSAHGERQHWIVPIDDCFRLIAVVRREWRGLSGGSRVWPAIDQFFADLAAGRIPRGDPPENTTTKGATT